MATRRSTRGGATGRGPSAYDHEALAMIAGEVRALCRQRVAVAASAWNEGHGAAQDLLPELRTMGLLGVMAGEAIGGVDLGVRGLQAVLRELGAADAGLGALVAQHSLALAWAERLGLAAAVTTAATGSPRLCLVDGGGSGHLDDPAPAFALRSGHLHGAAGVVLAGGGADLAVVRAVDADGGEALCVVDLRGAGATCTVAPPSIGLRSCTHVALALDAATPLAVQPLVGRSAEVALLHGLARLCAATLTCATARASHHAAVRYSLERRQFGKPIATFQPIQWQTADSETELTGAELLVFHAGAALHAAWSAGGPASGTPDISGPALDAVDRASIAAFEAARRATDRALQLHGGCGYTTDYGAERPYRDVYALPLLGGSAIAARARVAARLAAVGARAG